MTRLLQLLLILSAALCGVSCQSTGTHETFSDTGTLKSRTAVTSSAFRKVDKESVHIMWTKSGPVIIRTGEGIDEADIIDSYGNLEGTKAGLNALLGGKRVDAAVTKHAADATNQGKQIDATKAIELQKLKTPVEEAVPEIAPAVVPGG